MCFQEVVSNGTTSVQLRHILGLLFSVCAPSEEESEPVRDISTHPPTVVPPKVAPTKPSPPVSGGCLAGKRRRSGSALIPSGAKEVAVKLQPKTVDKQSSLTANTSSSKCDLSSKKLR